MRRIILGFLTLIVLVVSVGPALIGSLAEPQIGNRLELYQTDLLLQASELEPPDGFNATDIAGILGGTVSLEQVTTQYEKTQVAVQENLARLSPQPQANRADNGQSSGTPALGTPDTETSSTLESPNSPNSTPELTPPATSNGTQSSSPQREKTLSLNDDLRLRLGLLYALQDKSAEAIATWEPIAANTLGTRSTASVNQREQGATAEVLIGLWSDPAQPVPDAEFHLKQTLTGWFRTRALERLYTIQQQPDDLAALRDQEQQDAQATLVKLGLLGAGPALGCLIGVMLFVVLLAQRIIKGKESLLAANHDTSRWTTPWDWEITWQVLLVGFFFLGQIILPVAVSLLRGLLTPLWQQQGLTLNLTSGQSTAITTTIIYLLMAIASTLVLYFSIKSFLPLPEGWFKASLNGRWFLWGLGGYFCAVPLVIGVSILNQQIWQGRGGSNPLLEIVLNEGDIVALGIFFFTAAIAAPIFEEILFRGFLLPSLTRYMPLWGAIILSSVIFATAHLSFSEVLPLTILGMVLGFVYGRSRNLLASMMVHSLWNSATMVGLLVLGSSVN